ncbi:hypothetical protein BDV26DRAFT_114091 [Aspergillus bertholletiae]|uniref:Uncharacterized protein n=1 Tax=Aspergillus bertholletiae TaxID=1226010 RepID=A0A5N7AS95_9EURO|nr:hypothetical protein BDV26DRAFT_114091 [Aspergillus bertholletiae]
MTWSGSLILFSIVMISGLSSSICGFSEVSDYLSDSSVVAYRFVLLSVPIFISMFVPMSAPLVVKMRLIDS